jgi:Asp-tRNA(Asn)/Glu-tRNA(Gln) amidotransferase A subunit family amidase
MTKQPDNLTRRNFIAASAIAAAAGSAAAGQSADPAAKASDPSQSEGGQPEPPTDEISPADFERAQRLAGLQFTPEQLEMLAPRYGRTIAGYRTRREQPLPNGLAPATVFDPRLSQAHPDANDGVFVRSSKQPGPLPSQDIDIAFAPVTALSRWIELGALSSRRLTEIYLTRLERHDPQLQCVITLTRDRALAQAAAADREIAAGTYRGPLHGIPWGAKDLFDTANISTTFGAAPYKDRVPDSDAAVVQMLDRAGAVLVAKLTLGALAMGDVWYGGKTKNPWNTQQGSSGSSAGPAAATAAGLVGFSLGTETLGSIVSPCMRCGTTGLRPTFGRVPRAGAMALCWSLDKVGPICRTVEDCGIVLDAIRGADPGDPSAVDEPLVFDAKSPIDHLRIGYDPAWFESRGTTDVDRAALTAVKALGAKLVEIKLPDMQTGPLRTILNVEAASAFEELTLSGRDSELVRQSAGAWPNSFRRAWFTPAIEFVQAQRIRRQVCEAMQTVFNDVDLLFGPSFAGGLLLITNNTGHPSLTLRAGFRANNRPHGVTLWGQLFGEGDLCRVGIALEKKFNVWDQRPSLG